MRKRLVGAVASLLFIASLTACGPGPSDPPHPTAVPPVVATPGASSTPTPAALVPSFIVINAHSVSVGATTQQQIVEVPYSTDAATAVSLLAGAIGLEPTVSTIAGTDCIAETTIYDWGGLRLAAPAPAGAGPGASFIARGTAPVTTGGLTLEMTYADTVGASLADVVAHGPGGGYTVVSTDLGGGHGEAMLDAQDGGTWGVILVVETGIVTSYYAPGYYLFDYGDC